MGEKIVDYARGKYKEDAYALEVVFFNRVKGAAGFTYPALSRVAAAAGMAKQMGKSGDEAAMLIENVTPNLWLSFVVGKDSNGKYPLTNDTRVQATRKAMNQAAKTFVRLEGKERGIAMPGGKTSDARTAKKPLLSIIGPVPVIEDGRWTLKEDSTPKTKQSSLSVESALLSPDERVRTWAIKSVIESFNNRAALIALYRGIGSELSGKGSNAAEGEKVAAKA
jgi:hypothetical protein